MLALSLSTAPGVHFGVPTRSSKNLIEWLHKPSGLCMNNGQRSLALYSNAISLDLTEVIFLQLYMHLFTEISNYKPVPYFIHFWHNRSVKVSY